MATANTSNAMTNAIELDILERYLEINGAGLMTNGTNDGCVIQLVKTSDPDDAGSGDEVTTTSGTSNKNPVTFVINSTFAENDGVVTITVGEGTEGSPTTVQGFYIMNAAGDRLFYGVFGGTGISVVSGDKVEFADAAITVTLD